MFYILERARCEEDTDKYIKHVLNYCKKDYQKAQVALAARGKSSPKPIFTSPVIQQPSDKPNHKQRHEAINEHISRIDNQGEDDDDAFYI